MMVRMLETQKVSPDGIQIITYEMGLTYDFPETLGAIFLSDGWAERFSPSQEAMPKPVSVTAKDAGGAPENKSAPRRGGKTSRRDQLLNDHVVVSSMLVHLHNFDVPGHHT